MPNEILRNVSMVRMKANTQLLILGHTYYHSTPLRVLGVIDKSEEYIGTGDVDEPRCAMAD